MVQMNWYEYKNTLYYLFVPIDHSFISPRFLTYRQGAINFGDSSHPPGFEPRTAGLGLDHQQSIESTTSNQSHLNQLRRPRSLTHQSVGSQHGFSMFGSVDSEQSVPRTAPLATPEQVSIAQIGKTF